jgi:hypothetical protein
MRPVDLKKKDRGKFQMGGIVYVLAESKCCFYTPGIVHDVFTFDV